MTPRDVATAAFPGLEFKHVAPDPYHPHREYAWEPVSDEELAVYGDVGCGLKKGIGHLWVSLEIDVDERGVKDAAVRLVEGLRRLAALLEERG